MMDNEFKTAYGEWALIAGGAQGIGAAYADYIAARGVNVAIIDLDAQTLRQQCERLESQYGVQTLAVRQDLAAIDLLSKLDRTLGSREIGLLVYNAAIADVGPFFKPDTGLELELRKIAVNVTGPLSLVYHFSPAMLRRRSGGIVLMSSGTGLLGSPYYAHYAATKAYNINLAEGLYHEFKAYGVHVLACIAGMTLSSTMAEAVERGEGADFQFQTCEELVSEAMGALGTQPSLISGENNRQTLDTLLTLPREQALEALAAHAIGGFLGGEAPKQNV